MSREEHPVDDTLINLITNLKSKIKSEMRSFDYDSPLKRSLSSSCLFDYVTPAKKIRADLIEARNNILSLENRMKEIQIMFDNKLHSLEQQLAHDRKAVEELELKNELAEVQNKFDMLKLTIDSLNSLIKEFEKELTELKSDTTVVGDLKKEKVVSLRIRIEAAQEDAVKLIKSYQPN